MGTWNFLNKTSLKLLLTAIPFLISDGIPLVCKAPKEYGHLGTSSPHYVINSYASSKWCKAHVSMTTIYGTEEKEECILIRLYHMTTLSQTQQLHENCVLCHNTKDWKKKCFWYIGSKSQIYKEQSNKRVFAVFIFQKQLLYLTSSTQLLSV